MSSATKEVLDEFGYFDVQLRGDIEIKVMYCISPDCVMDAASRITSCSGDRAVSMHAVEMENKCS